MGNTVFTQKFHNTNRRDAPTASGDDYCPCSNRGRFFHFRVKLNNGDREQPIGFLQLRYQASETTITAVTQLQELEQQDFRHVVHPILRPEANADSTAIADLSGDSCGLVIDNDDFLQCRDEDIREVDVGRMGYVLRYAFRALECRLEHMSEALVQVLDAHILAPG